MILLAGTPKMGPPIYGNPHIPDQEGDQTKGQRNDSNTPRLPGLGPRIQTRRTWDHNVGNDSGPYSIPLVDLLPCTLHKLTGQITRIAESEIRPILPYSQQ